MSARFVHGVALILILTAGYACWCHAPLIWDGAYQLNATLIMQRPYTFLTRFHTFFLWWPTVWANRLTGNMMILQSVYGLPFLLAPVINVLLSWWMVRDKAPHLIIWSIFGLAAGSLPGQIFVINDSIFQQHLFWPIFLGMFVPLSIPKKIVLGVLICFQFCHQLGTLLFLGAAVATFIVGMVDTQNRRRMFIRSGVLFGLLILAVAKIVITNHLPQFYDSYAAQEATWATAKQRWHDGVHGWPIVGMAFMWIGGLLAYFQRRAANRALHRRAILLGIFCAVSVGIGATCWIYWAANGQLWWKALDFRRWVGPLTAPFFILAALEAFDMARRRGISKPSTSDDDDDDSKTLRQPLALLLAANFALVLGSQCHVWDRLTRELMAEVNDYPGPVVPQSAIAPLAEHTPLDHWGIADFVVAIQGKEPKKVLLDPRSEANIYADPPVVPHEDFYPDPHDPTPGPQGWFDFRPLLKQLSQTRHTPHGGPQRLDIQSTPN